MQRAKSHSSSRLRVDGDEVRDPTGKAVGVGPEAFVAVEEVLQRVVGGIAEVGLWVDRRPGLTFRGRARCRRGDRCTAARGAAPVAGKVRNSSMPARTRPGSAGGRCAVLIRRSNSSAHWSHISARGRKSSVDRSVLSTAARHEPGQDLVLARSPVDGPEARQGRIAPTAARSCRRTIPRRAAARRRRRSRNWRPSASCSASGCRHPTFSTRCLPAGRWPAQPTPCGCRARTGHPR